jgi:hypothetical protein
MRSEVSFQIASLFEGLGASDKRTDKVTFQICLKIISFREALTKGG